MHIDCDRCAMRGLACSDCVVSVLLGPARPELDVQERRALGVLADAGLVPPLRLVERESAGARDSEPATRKSDETCSERLRRMRPAG